MKGTIILFTKYFPYNKGQIPGETFLNNEIDFLAKTAEHIYIFALDARAGSKAVVDLPGNVTSYSMSCGKVGLMLLVLWNVFLELLFPSREVKEEKRNLDSIRKKLYLIYFAGKSNLYKKAVKRKIISNDVVCDEKVILYSYWFYTYARVAILIKEDCCEYGRVCSRAHRYDIYEESNSLGYLPMRKWLLEKLDYVFPCSENGQDYLIEKYPGYKNKIIASCLGSPDYGTNISGKEFVIFSCSRVADVKRVELILDVCIWLEHNIKDIRFVWKHIGNGTTLKELKKRAKREISVNKVEFLGALPNDNVISIYQNESVSLFLNVSTSEGVPISIMEAISFGIPVLATDAGGTGEIVKQDINGWLIPVNSSIEDIGKMIYKIYMLPDEEVEQIRENARKVWKEKFQINNNTEAMLRYLM